MDFYEKELKRRESLSLNEKTKLLNELLKRAKFFDENWYYFLRGIRLYEEGKVSEAINLMEKAFYLEKNLMFCQFITKIYEENKDEVNKKLWLKKKNNLVRFLRTEDQNKLLINHKETIKRKLLDHANGNLTIAEQYIKRYFDRKDNLIDSEISYIKVLKEWSSSTPLMYQGVEQNENVGGGFFIRWKNKGIVIDPGLNFVQNLHKANLSVLDIDIVIVTHNHIDHNSDLKVILDIKYQCESALQYSNIKLNTWEKDQVSRSIRFYVDHSTYEEHRKNFEENKCDVTQFDTIISQKEKQHIKYSDSIEIQYFKTIHINQGVSYGIVLDLKNGDTCKKIGFTSDTKYFPELPVHMSEVDYLIANLSEIEKADLCKKGYKYNHLGYHGCCDLICHNEIYPTYFILSEFWGGKGDIRQEIAQYLKIDSLSCKKDIYIIAGDTELCIDLENDNIRCSKCGGFVHRDNIAVQNTEGRKLIYICNRCEIKK
ncbi:MAG TPA: MBL fold metallo-hydrolase [Candidatus Blautia faecipullorum]|nr:MBL fold metallo-hydrolase [Candidatus Blautia faecipullorum]